MSKREDSITAALKTLERDDHIQDLYVWETSSGSPRWTFHTTVTRFKRVGLNMSQAEAYLLGWRDAHDGAR